MSGDSFQEFVGNLNSIHSRVSVMLPKLTPPSFKITDQTDSSCSIHYYSQRQGLFPMVEGMVAGISDWYNTPIEVETELCEGESPEHTIFHVRFK